MNSFDPKELVVIAPITNPLRFRSRHNLYKNFARQVKDHGANLITVETTFGHRHYHFTQAQDINDVRLRTHHELWLKENSINIGIQHALHRFPDTKYVAWIDADILFTNPHWATETIEQLQHFKVVQMFSHAIDLGPNMEPLETHVGFAFCWRSNDCMPPQGAGRGGYYGYGEKPFWHPGFAWAARRESLDALGGLIDFAILGAGDHHMALGLIGEMARSVPRNMAPRYLKKLLIWQDRAERFIKRDLGFVPGTINHYWHGKKKDRRYSERWDVLTKNGFDPDLDLKRDAQGLFQLTDRNWKLRVDIEAYFRNRAEDSIDL